MRIATRDGLLTYYTLRDTRNGPALARVDLKSLTSAGTITVGDVAYAFEQADLWGKEIVLTFEGVELATATRASAWSSKTRIAFAPGGLRCPDLRLIPLGAFSIGFHVEHDEGEHDEGERVGRIERKGVFKTAIHLRQLESLPLVVQGFLTALVLIDLRRRQSS